jgi:hypothetical protein
MRSDIGLLPLYIGDGDGTVFVSSDTWPGTGGVLGRTQAQIAETKATDVQPTRTGGFAYLRSPDDATVEYAGNQPAERFNHVHLYQEQPFCAQLWYQTHLHAPVYAGRTGSMPLSEALIGPGPDSNPRACSAHRRPPSPLAMWRSCGICLRVRSHSWVHAGRWWITSG